MRLLWRFVLATAMGAAGSVDAQAPLALEDVLDLPVFEGRQPIARSPDGRYVAAALNRPSRKAARAEPSTRWFVSSGIPASEAPGDDIWLIDLRTGEHIDITAGVGSSWGPAWSPDGRYVAFYSDRDGAARVWIWDRDSYAIRRVSEQIVRPFWAFETPKWFPDSNRLLVKLIPAGMTLAEARALLPEPGPPVQGAGDPDTRAAAVKVFASNDGLLEVPGEAAGTAPPPGSDVHFLNRSLGDLAIIELPSGRARRLAERVRAQNYSLSPDGRFVLYAAVRWHEIAGHGDVVYSLIVIDAATGQSRTLATDALRDYGITVSWAPVGQRIAYADTAGLVVVGAANAGAPLNEWRELGRISRSGMRFRSDYTPPLWSADATHLYAIASDSVWEVNWREQSLRSLGAVAGSQLIGLVGDFGTGLVFSGAPGDAVYAVVRSRATMRMGFAQFSLHVPSIRVVWSDDISMAGPRFGAAPANDGTVAFVAQDAARPEEIWLFNADSATARKTSNLHRDIGRYALGPSRLVSWQSVTGDSLRGALVLPSSYQEGGRLPLIVRVYPGSNPSRAVNRFGTGGVGVYNAQLLAARGYAVLLPDIPPSRGRPVDVLAESVLPALDRLIEMGIADPDRIGVTGVSAGGFAAIALLTKSNRFSAAIAEAAGASLFRDYLNLRSDGSSPGIARVEDYGDGMGGPPWGDRLGAYIAQSPLFHLDHITAPLLLINGEADETVPSSFSGEVFVGLRRLDRRVVIALYRGEGHVINAWSRANLDDYWQRVVAWWERWLGGG